MAFLNCEVFSKTLNMATALRVILPDEGELGAALEESLDASLDASLAEESLLEVDEEDKAKLESLAEQETRINTLLQSKKQMQSLKEKYENKILQIASQLELLTVGE